MKYLDLLQYIVIQQEIKDSDCYDTLFISIRFDIIFHDYNFFEILYIIFDYSHKHYTFKQFEV